MAQFSRRSTLRCAAVAAKRAVSVLTLSAMLEPVHPKNALCHSSRIKLKNIRGVRVRMPGPRPQTTIYLPLSIYRHGERRCAAVVASLLIHGWGRVLVGLTTFELEPVLHRTRILDSQSTTQGSR